MLAFTYFNITGASLGNLICPNNTVAACATVDQIGSENKVMKRTLQAFAIILGGVHGADHALHLRAVSPFRYVLNIFCKGDFAND